MTELSAFTFLPPTLPVRARWVEYPYCARTGVDVSECGCSHCGGKPLPVLWEGVACREDWTKNGTVIAFARGLLLVAGDDGRTHILPVEAVQILSSGVQP